MNKKGEEAKPVPALVLVLIAAAILVIAYIFLFGPGKEVVFKLFNITPSYNITQPRTESIQIIRYDIKNDKLEWYDGLNFYPFDAPEIKLGDKKVQESTLLSALTNIYYDRSLPQVFTIPAGERANQLIKPFGRGYKEEFSVINFDRNTRGEALIRFETLSFELPEGYFTLTRDNKLLENIAAKNVGEIIKLSEPFDLINIKIEEDYLVINQIEEHLGNIHGLQFPKIGTHNTLKSVLTSQNLHERIALNNEYIFVNTNLKENEATYQLYNQDSPLRIFLALEIEEIGRVDISKILKTQITALAASIDEFKEFKTIDKPETIMITEISTWRDSVLSQPKQITYYEGETGTFCVEKINNIYLVIDLADPKTTC